MRIALDARYLNGKGSGIGSYTHNLARAMLQADPRLELLLVVAGNAPAEFLADPRVQTVRFPFSPNSISTRLMLGPFLRRHAFDLFHSPFPVAPANLRRPLVVTVHDLMWLVNPSFNTNSLLLRAVAGTFYRASLTALMGQAQRILTVSHASRNAIVEHSPWHNAKVRVTHNGMDKSRIYPLDRAQALQLTEKILPRGAPFVLTVGDASPHKNHINAVKGFMEAFSGRPEYRMVLVRRFLRRDRQMRHLLADPRVQEKVIPLGHVSHELLNALNNAARISLQPSYYEGFGIPLLEAMACNTPVVTSRTSCLPEVAGDAALLVDPADPLDIAEALRRLDEDSALRRDLVDRGRRRLEHFTWSACAEATLEVYRELL